MKINYTMWTVGLTGGVRVIFEIANRLIERGHEVTVTALRVPPFGARFPSKAKIKYAKYSPSLFGANYIFWKAKLAHSSVYRISIDALIERLTKCIPYCDVNVATFCFTAFSVHRSGKGIPFYHMQHYEASFWSDTYIKRMVEETYYLPLNKIANSTWLRNLMKRKFGLEVPIVNPGIDSNVFYPRDLEKETSKKRIICLGRAGRHKGFPDALEAVKIVMKKRRDVEFVVYGSRTIPYSDPEVPFKFVLSPSDDELAKLYSSADVVVFPSWYESFPLPPLEAMACGTPVVTTRCGTEDYAFHEENALVVPPKEPEKMAQAILRILSDNDLSEKFTRKGIGTAKQFTWDKTVDRIEVLFKDAM